MDKLPKVPGWLILAVLFLGTATVIPFVVIAKARHVTSTKPRIHIIRDMDNQERFNAQSESPLFADGRAMRPPVPGTVARGELRADAHFHEGLSGGASVTTFPTHDDQMREIVLDQAFFARGQERYAIHCGPCHGMSGYGDGMVARRVDLLKKKEVPGNDGWATPANLHVEAIRTQSVGDLFATVTNGNKNMAGYRWQIPARDRWAIVFYVKALQASQHPE